MFVVTLPLWHFCWWMGFCHRAESDLFLFLSHWDFYKIEYTILGSHMVETDFIKQYDVPSPKSNMAFWSMTIYSDILHLSHINLTRDIFINLILIT